MSSLSECARFGANITAHPGPSSEAIVPAEEPEVDATKWSSGPKELQGLLDSYVVETRIPGRHPGTSLFLVNAARRDSETVGVVPGQKFKLFLAPCWILSRLFLAPFLGPLL